MGTKLLINFILFQIGWFACVLGGAMNMAYIGPMVVLVILAYHLHSAQSIKSELRLVGFVTLLGLIWDSVMVISGLFVYQSGMFHSALAPYWIIAMWALFASTLNVSLRWLKESYMLAIIFGAIGGPLAYYAGFKLDAVELPNMTLALSAQAMGWAVMMPLLMMFAKKWNGFK